MNKEIALIRKKLKKKKRELRKINKDLKNAKNYVKRKNRITELYRAQTNNKSKKDIEIQNYNFKISWLKNLKEENNMYKYFKYFKMECDNREAAKTKASTIESMIDNKINKKTKLEKEEEKFYSLDYQFK